VPKHVGEATAMFLLIKDEHSVGTIKGVRRLSFKI
jgi:hypothetical protein